MTVFKYIIMIVVIVYPVHSSLSVDSHGIGSHGGKVLKSGKRVAEVQIDTSNHSAVVYLRQGNSFRPNSVELTLYDKNKSPMTFELRALSPTDHGITRYGGSISSEPSSMGIELRIPLAKGGKDVLRAD